MKTVEYRIRTVGRNKSWLSEITGYNEEAYYKIQRKFVYSEKYDNHLDFMLTDGLFESQNGHGEREKFEVKDGKIIKLSNEDWYNKARNM